MNNLRKQLRQRRRQLNAEARQWASQLICQNIVQLSEWITARKIAGYQALPEEVNLTACLSEFGKTIYLPKIEANRLQFRLWDSDNALIPNDLGILEPGTEQPKISPSELDLVLVPLVGFDRHGQRLGMGGGFYDRTFSFRIAKTTAPFLLGVAFECQCVTNLVPQPWDVKLDAIATESGLYRTGSFMPWPIG